MKTAASLGKKHWQEVDRRALRLQGARQSTCLELCTVAAVCGIQGRRSGPGRSGYRSMPHVANLLALRLQAPGESALASPFPVSALWVHAPCRPQHGEKYCGQIPCQSWYIFGWCAVVNRRIVPSSTRGEG